ncbi:MAG TPA: hypothetical protein VNM71_04295, partial [Steroidobacteraceae bacterium]|nr:hypothetical protein [Steroidobacteraceae bacterium]
MKHRIALLAACAALSVTMSTIASSSPVQLPLGYLPLAESQPVIDKTLVAHLSPDISKLTARERATVAKLLEAGSIFEDLYEEQRYPGAVAARAQLYALDQRLGSPAETRNLITLYYMNRG